MSWELIIKEKKGEKKGDVVLREIKWNVKKGLLLA